MGGAFLSFLFSSCSVRVVSPGCGPLSSSQSRPSGVARLSEKIDDDGRVESWADLLLEVRNLNFEKFAKLLGFFDEKQSLVFRSDGLASRAVREDYPNLVSSN